MKKKPIFLFEILIALSLTAILLTFLFSFFVESAKIEKKLEKARMAISARNYVQSRLQSVLSSVVRGSESHFYTKQFEKETSPSLVIVFDNGIDPEPAFSGEIVGRIFIDEDQNLCLAAWPLSKNKNRPWRKEVLMPQVASFEFEFLGKKSAEEHAKKEKMRPVTAELVWRTSWAKGQLEIPSMIRLTVQEKTVVQFAFILPSTEPFVTYLERKVS